MMVKINNIKDAVSMFLSFSGFIALTLLFTYSFLLINQNAKAQLLCPESGLIQVTDVTDSADVNAPSISADGSRTVFDSDGDLLGQSGGNNQVYLYDEATKELSQITPASSSSSNPSISGDGTLVALESDMNINGGNPDGNDEIFLLDLTTGVFTQVTFTNGASNFGTSISSDGTYIAFNSNANINGGNPEGNPEIYLYNILSSTISQITDEPSGSSVNPSINANGTIIAFQSDANIGGGNIEGNREIYYYSSATGIITQVTNTNSGDSSRVSIDGPGTQIAFQSFADITGENPDGNTEIFLYDLATGIITQITSTPGGFSQTASMSLNGNFLAFVSTGDFAGNNPDGNRELYVYDIGSVIFTQVTDGTSGSNSSPAINADGSVIAFDSTSNLTGDNPDNRCQLMIQICRAANASLPIPTLSEWGLMAMIGILGLVGFIAMKRRKAAA